ncbi:MAG: bifunctional (p)ppGpp synthetase/guanosine-3',5'-bis(diphosphate) 3'-pyrophosphohydrolase [Caulobacteraceae bacterium]|nr:bifunctional (p)ppGpp synthetase/guanosine-3',5'-bis(diphosphate) 3'-pyrophosphohydrolase [Caulobacteraceae bacterium]
MKRPAANADPIIQLARAYHFAAEKHVGHRRKGEAAEPYMNHLTEVAELAAAASAGDLDIVMGAVLHDTVEDTDASLEELGAAFGAKIAALVAEVTDDKRLPRLERKALQVAHAPNASHGAKIIKLADKISNLRALTASPPAGWPRERCEEYVAWAQQVVEGCRAASPWLAARFDEAVEAYRAVSPRR